MPSIHSAGDARSPTVASGQAPATQSAGQDLPVRLRWGLFGFAVLGLVPWAVDAAHRERPAWLLAGLAGASVALWRWRLSARAPGWLIDLLHGPLVGGLSFALSGVGGTESPGRSALFLLTMYLQAFGGSWSAFGLRAAAVAVGFVVGSGFAAKAGFTSFGLTAAGLVNFLLARALERQARSLRRTQRLADLAATLGAAVSTDELLRHAAGVLQALDPAIAWVGLKVTSAAGLSLEARAGAPVATSDAALPPLTAEHSGHRVVATVALRAPADDDLAPALQAAAAMIAQAAARAELAVVRHEVEIAARIQSSLLPRRLDVPGFDVAASMEPAADVGGDYFDVVPSSDGCFVGIGDVSGHGLASGLVMLMVQSAVSALLRGEGRPSVRDVVLRLNRVLYDNVRQRLGSHEHVTFTLLEFKADGRVTFAGAHEELLVLRASGALETISTPGTWLGAAPDVAHAIVESTLRLQPGDLVLLYTDGAVELRNAQREEFGMERLGSALREVGTEPAEKIVAHLRERLAAFGEARLDDRSVVLVRYLGHGIGARPGTVATEGRA